MGERLRRLTPPLLPFLGSLVLILLTGIWMLFANNSSLATQVAVHTTELRVLERKFDRLQQIVDAWHGPPGPLLP